MGKSVILTNEQVRRAKGMILKETFAVNTYLVKKVVDYLDKTFAYTKYDDMNENGDVVKNVAVQIITDEREPLQTISVSKMMDKIDPIFKKYIKDDKERRAFLKQVVKDWINGDITRDGLLSVNSTGD